MSDLKEIGHTKRWLFTEAELQERRRTSAASVGSPLTADEELLLVRFYAEQVHALCGNIGLPDTTAAVAAVFLLRLYSGNSVAAHDPLLAMATCVFLASKVDERHIPPERIHAETHVRLEDILAFEYVLLTEICFDVHVVLPHRAAAAHIGTSRPQSLDASKSLLRYATVCDALLLFPPGHVALAVARMACGEGTTVDGLLAERGVQMPAAALEELRATVSRIEAMITEVRQPRASGLTAIDKRLKQWKKDRTAAQQQQQQSPKP